MTLALSSAGAWLSLAGEPLGLVAGTGALSLASLRWFLLLHEAGHRTLFSSRCANAWAQSLAGLLAGIPGRSWRRVHAQHHRWTGWQDVDPTTARLAGPLPGRVTAAVLNLAWALWVPLLALLYRRPFWTSRAGSRAERLERAAVGAAWCGALAAGFAGGGWRLWPGLLLGAVFQELLIVSQHSHLPQGRAEGTRVRPIPAADQPRFTRSLRVPRWISWLLLGAEAHGLHHRFPQVPGPLLARIELALPHCVPALGWVREAKRHSATRYLFRTGADS